MPKRALSSLSPKTVTITASSWRILLSGCSNQNRCILEAQCHLPPGNLSFDVGVGTASFQPSGVTSKPASRGHLKTGQLSASRTTCFYPTCDRSGKFFLEVRILFTRAARFILTSPGRRVRQRRDATGAPTQRPEWRGGASRPKKTSHSGGKAVNPRGMGTESPSKKAFFRFDLAPAKQCGGIVIERLPQS